MDNLNEILNLLPKIFLAGMIALGDPNYNQEALERSRRLNGLVNIGIHETSYKKGHKNITVIVNHDTNTVVWAAEGHGKKILEQFYRCLDQVRREVWWEAYTQAQQLTKEHPRK